MPKKIRLASRASQLAMIQANMIKNQLESCMSDIEVEIYPITTQGDKDLKSPLYEIGGKGVFIKEVEHALIENTADIAVHSLKDITSELASGLELTGFLVPEGFHDVMVHKTNQYSFNTLPQQATLATGSLRRKALLKYLRPDLKTVEMRGNVLTRLEKLKELDIAAMLLSEAGLIRLDINNEHLEKLDKNIFVPAPGQGVIALETRIGDEFFSNCAKKLNDPRQALKSSSELAFLRKVGLDCRAPLGLHAVLSNNDETMALSLFLSTDKMSTFLKKTIEFPTHQRNEWIHKLAEESLEWLKKNEHSNTSCR